MKPRRSILSVPAHVEKFHAKALNSNVDVIMFDLEDSVPFDKKSEAREKLISVLQDIETDKVISFRTNPVDSQFVVDDIYQVLNNSYEKIDSIVIPKVENSGDIHFVDRMIESIKISNNSDHKIGIEASIETVNGMENISEIAKSSNKLISLVFGIADFTASLGASLVSISGHGENEEDIYPGHRWHYALSKIAITAKANDLIAIDAPFGNFRDENGLLKSSQTARASGIDGKWAIHPEQINTINRLFSPSEIEVEFAAKIIEAAKEANKNGRASAQIDGKMIDAATLRIANKTYAVAKELKIL
jgi:citrate lyase subunit beta/citryl-CoA lyase/malyl-CoA/(S)-citramalyl-CoA lyase